MRHLWLTVIATLIVSILIGGSPVLANAHPTENTKAEIQLTTEQKNELAAIQKELLKNKKTLIDKYVEYGVMTKEQGEKINSRFDLRFKQLEKNGFVLTNEAIKKHTRNRKCH